PLCPHNAIELATWWRLKRPAPRLRLKQCRGRIELGDRVKVVAVEAEQGSELCFADTCCILQHSLEHRLKFTGRRTDDTQHITSPQRPLRSAPPENRRGATPSPNAAVLSSVIGSQASTESKF